MTRAIIIWALKVPVLLVLSALAWCFSWFFAFFIIKDEESAITGHPSLYLGKPREFLIPMFRIWQTSDAPVDEYYWAEYEMDGWLQRNYRADYLTSSRVRWMYRIWWLCRNPAYGFGKKLGWNGSGMRILTSYGSDDLWYSGKSSCSYWTAINDANQLAFYLQIRLYFYKNRCLDILAGYKFFSDPQTKFVAMRFNPCRKYPK